MRYNMKERREELCLSQQDVSDKIPFMTRGNYSSIERGRTEPNIKQMISIAKVLEVEPKLNFFKDFCDETDQNKKECIS
ncbi:helix-turn-helix transcriptional regulator [Paraliobacillus ryukyuensis]|uniref:helix-turn-helix transcriptional regulator n=1 Tax=Paraliobacillus ryukyuensis TaxID=200904 RepID=UPI0009A5FA17|nr:helix-turn-helix transcriptional regulator [Paraliobacillus ryukyuensis]